MYDAAMKCTNNGVTYKEALETCSIPTETWEVAGQMTMNFIKGECVIA